MSPLQIIGALLIISAVLSITQKKHEQSIPRKNLILGITLGISAMFTVAVGIVMIKPLLRQVPLLWAALFRLLGAALSLGVVLLFHPRRHLILAPLLSLQNWKPMVPASILGAYFSLLFWLGGMKYTFASVAGALNQLSTIFIFILAMVFLREKVTSWRIFAIITGFAGAFLVSFH